MPRVTTKEQFARYQYLFETYQQNQSFFSWMSFEDQNALHRFYQPNQIHTLGSFSKHELEILRTDPSLPNRAGKLYKKLLRGPRTKPQRQEALVPGSRGRRLVVRAVPREHIDVQQLARALASLVYEEAKQKAREERLRQMHQNEDKGEAETDLDEAA
jgi:hypothetical protein